MSDIYSFRLSKSNPREAQVIKFIHAKTREGMSLRQMITDGLLALSSNPLKGNISDGETIQSMFSLILDLLQQSDKNSNYVGEKIIEETETNTLSEKFTASLMREAKRGLQVPNK